MTYIFRRPSSAKHLLEDKHLQTREKKHFNQYMEVDNLSESQVGEKGSTNPVSYVRRTHKLQKQDSQQLSKPLGHQQS